MDRKKRIAAVILSAGFSSRMGDFKPLLRLGSYTAIEHAIHCFEQSDIQDIRVVIGHQAEVMMAALAALKVQIVRNDRFAEGMYSSVQAGVTALGPDVEAFFLLPVDTPLVKTATIRAMTDAYHDCGKGILYPTFHGKRGHPPLIAAGYAGEILRGDAPDGLRGLLTRHHEDAAELTVNDEAVLLDMDVPADYERLLAHLACRAVPGLTECRHLLRLAEVDQPVWDHCHVVAGFAVALTRQLNRAGAALDEDLVLAGALLHDVARRKQHHAEVGARFILDWGYPRVAELVAVHMDIVVAGDEPISEAEVVYLADKMTKGNSIVTIAERSAGARERHKTKPQALQAATRRMQQAEVIRMKVQNTCGIRVESVVPLDLQ